VASSLASRDSICVEPSPPCALCGSTIGCLGIHQRLALALRSCPCGHGWTVNLCSAALVSPPSLDNASGHSAGADGGEQSPH
jgi:hypothetical protein